ncbi:MAG: VWA domain-containing protein, partial [Ruminococcus sp.]|nr:VWA domain-containing protein [Ruminococcus sp.]
ADYKAPEKDEQGNKKVSKSSTEITLDGESKLCKDTEIMFIVDTTGSMSDEMLFLQSEFSAIAREVGSDNVKYAVSFYRDEGDDYVTKHNDFTSDVSALQKALNNEEADGGGDFPEAVAQVLSETITDGKWSKDSVKLAFLIFDAPPHEGTDKKLMEAAKAAGEKGIRIVPIVSSGSDRETELFARSLAIMSGGTYVFLTDDSGIGGGHLEPIIGDYKVEKLYDIIIRVINDYRQ